MSTPSTNNGRRERRIYEYVCAGCGKVSMRIRETPYSQNVDAIWEKASFCYCDIDYATQKDEYSGDYYHMLAAILPFERERPRIYYQRKTSKAWQPISELQINKQLCKRHHEGIMLALFNPEELRKKYANYSYKMQNKWWWLESAIRCRNCKNETTKINKIAEINTNEFS